METTETCDLCGRPGQELTKHHLIPRAVHKKKRFANRFGKQEMRQRGLMLCKLCHSGLHDLFPSEQELADKYNTREALLADERTGKVCTILNKLDREVLEFIEPLWSDWQESKAKVDTAVNAVNDLERIARERSEHLDTLAELVNQYETRLAELVA